MDLPVGEEYQSNIPLKDAKIVQLLQDLQRSSLDGCVIFTLKQEGRILDGKILFEVGNIVAAALETDNNVLEVGSRALRSVIQEINVSDGYFEIQKFTADQIDLTKEMNTETVINEPNVWDIVEKASLERPPAKRTTINKETGVSDLVQGIDQMGGGLSSPPSQPSSSFDDAFSMGQPQKQDNLMDTSKKGPPPLEMLEGFDTKPAPIQKESSPMDILDAFSSKTETPPPPKTESPLDALSPPTQNKSDFDIFGDIVPKVEKSVEMPTLDIPVPDSLPDDLKELMSMKSPPIGPPDDPISGAMGPGQSDEKLTLPKKWYIRKLQKMGDLKSAIKQVATLAKGNHDLLKMDERFLKEGFSMNELDQNHLSNLAYLYEIKNHAICLITGDKTAGFDILARVTDSKATYIPQLTSRKLIEAKHSEKEIMIYKTTPTWKSECSTLL